MKNEMNRNPEHDDARFLSQWLAGEISDAELQRLVTPEDFNAYRKLKATLASYEIAPPDMDSNFAAVQVKLRAKKAKKPVTMLRWTHFAAAASIVLLFWGWYALFVFTNHAATGFGETKTVLLSDGSKVRLDAKSKMSFAELFRYNRSLNLHGEAYFEVAKGSVFTVETQHGSVQVLGTRFNIISRPGFFEVSCFDGSVKVCHGREVEILTRGNAVRFYKGEKESWHLDQSSPGWLSGESSFKNAPLRLVIAQLAAQYGFEVHYPQKFAEVRFTGSFTHGDPGVALQSICLPLKLRYVKAGTRNIILSE